MKIELRKVLDNQQGESVPIPAALLIIVFSLVLSFAIYIGYVQLRTSVVRNAMNKGLSNLAITISEDTYTALRESNFDEYVSRLTSSTDYRRELEEKYRNDVKSAVEIDNDHYKIENITLDFAVDGKKLSYVCTCDVTFYVRLFGNSVPAAINSVQVAGSHNAKYGR